MKLTVRHAWIVTNLLSLVVVAFSLRFVGWYWDEGANYALHPDERHMVTVTTRLSDEGSRFDTENSGLNPYNHSGITSYVYGQLPMELVYRISKVLDITERRDVIRIGRHLSAIWSTATVLALALIGWRLTGLRNGLMAGWLMAFTMLSVQQAHFYTVDSAGVFFTTLCIGIGLIALREHKPKLLIVSGAMVGLAMACRINLALLAFWVTAATMALAWREKNLKPLTCLIGAGFTALVVFRIFQPMAFDAAGILPGGLNPQWRANLDEVRAISQGTLEVPFTLQWVRRVPYVYALTQLAGWGLGWPLGAMCLSGIVMLMWLYRKRPGAWPFLLGLWPLILIGYHGGIFLHTLRYFLPAYPALILCGVLALQRIPVAELRRLTFGLVLGLSALYVLAYHTMLEKPHPWTEASIWVYENFPDGATVLCENWDDALPLRIKGSEEIHSNITFLNAEVYPPDTHEKIRHYLEQIEQADLIILSSTRASYTIPRFPERYPAMSRFYNRLAEGESRSGLREIARFHRQPELGGIALDTLQAEEAFRVYDHPLVRVYEKTPIFSVEALFAVLTENIPDGPPPYIPYTEVDQWNGGWLQPDQWQRRQVNPSAKPLFQPDTLGNRAPLLIWAFVLVILSGIGFPFAVLLFPGKPGTALAVSRLIALLLIGWLAWFPAALEWVSFSTSLPLAVLITAGTAVWLIRKNPSRYLFRRERLKNLLAGEMVFWVCFAIFLILRLLQPDLWHPWAGGEKPMDLAFLNATSRSEFFPPPNPWLSGAFINYYYYGFVLVGSLCRLTGIDPGTATNLALPTFAAFTGSLAFSIVQLWTPLWRRRPGRRDIVPSAVLAVILLLFMGNLGQARWLMEGQPGHSREGYWNASRVLRIPDAPGSVITEFPFFSHLYGDLHAHLMALPIALLHTLLCWQLLRRFHPLSLLAAAGVLGSLWVTNAWDFPIQACLLLAALFLPALRKPPAEWPAFIWPRFGWAAIALLTAYALFSPFHRSFLAPPFALIRWNGPRSSWSDLVLAYGLFLLPLITGLVLLYVRQLPLRRAPLRFRLFPGLMIGGCLLLIVLLEGYALKGDIGRMNTVFKFSYQVWWLLALVTAPIAWSLIQFRGVSVIRKIISAEIILLLLLAALYPLTAVPAKLKDRFWAHQPKGLDGLAYMKENDLPIDRTSLPLEDDLAGIRWLQQNTVPFQVLIEAQLPEYEWGSRFSTHTGHPAVLGWNWHMRQQRPEAEGPVWQRAFDVETFYTTTDPATAKAILERYDVDIVVCGSLELITYGPDLKARLEAIPGLTPVFEHGFLTLFRTASSLSPPSSSIREKPQQETL